jgi:serine/threonine protein kinase
VLGHLGDHPNIATVLDRWNEGDTAFMTTRYLSGGSLKELIADARKSGTWLPTDEIMRISAEIANGLAHIHACASSIWTCSQRTCCSTSGARPPR